MVEKDHNSRVLHGPGPSIAEIGIRSPPAPTRQAGEIATLSFSDSIGLIKEGRLVQNTKYIHTIFSLDKNVKPHWYGQMMRKRWSLQSFFLFSLSLTDRYISIFIIQIQIIFIPNWNLIRTPLVIYTRDEKYMTLLKNQPHNLLSGFNAYFFILENHWKTL